MIVDASRYQTVADTSPISDAIGGLISQRIAEKLSQRALSGDAKAYAELASRDPRQAQAIGGILRNQQEQQAAEQQAEAERQKQRQEFGYKIARGYKTASDKPAYLRYAAQQMQQLGHEDMAAGLLEDADAYATNPAAVDGDFDNAVAMFGPESDKLNTSQTYNDLIAMGYQPGTPEFNAKWEQAKKSGGQNISLTVDNGKQEMTKSTATDVQGQILDAEKELSSLDAIANKYSGEFLTYKGRLKAYAGKQFDRAGVDSALTGFNAKRTAFKNEVNQFFNKYKKEITGAAASEQEMIDLRNSIFNEDLGPEEFMSAYNQFKDKARKNYEMNKRTARSGVDVAVDPKYNGMTDEQLKKELGL
jgi:hypothetical protein